MNTARQRPTEAPQRDKLAALLSAAVPGLGQLTHRRVGAALLLFTTVAAAYVAFLLLLNFRFGAPGELFSLTFLDYPKPIRPPAEHWGILVLGLSLHTLGIVDAWRGATRAG